jgi:hypothetical protein
VAYSIEKEIIHTLSYFAFFSYPVTLKELHLYLRQKISQHDLRNAIERLQKNKKVLKIENMYTLGEYSIRASQRAKRTIVSVEKIKKIHVYINILERLSMIQLVGISGSLAMLNGKKTDDIDLFVVSRAGRLWTSRFFCLGMAQLLGIRRSRASNHAPDKVCLNLFFDESNLQLPKKKRTEYGAHELLQMKPIIDKNKTYDKLIVANNWIFDIFPNSKDIVSTIYKEPFYKEVDIPFVRRKKVDQPTNGEEITGGMAQRAGDFLEVILKNIQLFFIRRHRTTEIIADTQLWFFPKDFEKRIQKYSDGIFDK